MDVKSLLPILKALGLDKQAKAFTKTQLSKRLKGAIPKAATRLQNEGVTPALKSADPLLETAMLRAAMYRLAKIAISNTGIPFGADILADQFRDRAAPKVIPVVAPQVTPQTTLNDMLVLLVDAWVEQLT